MVKSRLHKLLIIAISLGMLVSLFTMLNINKNISAEDDIQEGPVQNDYYTVIKENGDVVFKKYNEEDNEMKTLESNDYEVVKKQGESEEIIETFDTYEKAEDAIKKIKSRESRMRTFSTEPTSYTVEAVAETRTINYGVAILKGYISSYREVESDGSQGREGYTHGTSANDAAYISTSSDGKTIRVKQAGIVMDVPASKVEIQEYNADSKVNYYMGSKGKFYHYYYHGDGQLASTQVGYTPLYLKDDVKYYSYDGHYFYSTYTKMIDDYKSGFDYYANAINVNSPFYNYYQYLSFRTTTQFNANDFNNLIVEQKGSDTISKLKDQGQAYINSQNNTGINASLMFGVSINESGWGLSNYALERNNLFGLGAVDSNPDKAYYFDSVEDCLKYFSYNSISSGYLNGSDYRYRGPHLGDKRSGVNVKYASDPYWGEKAASFSYRLNEKADNKDLQKYQIAISKNTKQNLYADASLTKKIYDSSVSNKYENLYCYPVTVLATEGNSYKILSDTVLNDSRTGKNPKGYFNISRDYVYLSINDIKDADSNLPSYLVGDVNGDGQVLADDYMQIKLHVLNRKILSGGNLVRADVNNDGAISASDYMLIKLHVLGRKLLF